MSRKKLVAATAMTVLFGACASAIWATVSTTAEASASPTSLWAHGRPFFPVMLIDQCSAAATARAQALGVNMVLNEHCPGVAPDTQLRRLSGAQVGIVPIGSRNVAGHRFAGWTYPDEPENNGWTAARLRDVFRYARGNHDGLISVVTLTSGFFDRAPFRNPHLNVQETRAIARLADVAGFDLYPLNHCQQDLTTVYEAQRQFVRLAGQMPTFQWIETAALDPHYCGGITVTPTQVTAEAWLAVIGGARGIGFFTHTLHTRDPLAVSAPVAGAISSFAHLAADVKPGLVGRTLGSSANSPAIKVLARRGSRSIYVFGANAGAQHVAAQVHVPRLADGSLEVVGEHRTVTVSNHRFADVFAPLAVHVYARTS